MSRASHLYLLSAMYCIVFVMGAASPVERGDASEEPVVYTGDVWLPYGWSDEEPERRYNKRHTWRPKKTDVFVSRGWGAGGMPFNVLYTPTTMQHKILRSAPEKYAAPQSMALSAPPRAYDLVEEAPRAKSEGLRPTAPRRHYSIIPQLFVSYGWGPLGK